MAQCTTIWSTVIRVHFEKWWRYKNITKKPFKHCCVNIKSWKLCYFFCEINLISMNDVIMFLCTYCSVMLFLHLNLFTWFYEEDALKNLIALDMVQSTPIWVDEIIQVNIREVIENNGIYFVTLTESESGLSHLLDWPNRFVKKIILSKIIKYSDMPTDMK